MGKDMQYEEKRSSGVRIRRYKPRVRCSRPAGSSRIYSRLVLADYSGEIIGETSFRKFNDLLSSGTRRQRGRIRFDTFLIGQRERWRLLKARTLSLPTH